VRPYGHTVETVVIAAGFVRLEAAAPHNSLSARARRRIKIRQRLAELRSAASRVEAMTLAEEEDDLARAAELHS
jgi:hypothetical protein